MYDARRTSSSPRLSDGAIGAVTLVAFIGVFCTVLFWPTAQAREAAAAKQYHLNVMRAEDNVLRAALPGLNTNALNEALYRLDTDLHQTLTAALKQSDTKTKSLALVADTVETAFATHAPSLANIDVATIDALSVDAQSLLSRASLEEEDWCHGAHYVGPDADMDPAAILNGSETSPPATRRALQQALITLSGKVIAAANKSARAGKHNARLTAQDRAALQGIMFSLSSDPQIRPVLRAWEAGGDIGAEIAVLDACSAGVSIISALRTLPQDTKARAWAEAWHGGEGFVGLSPQ